MLVFRAISTSWWSCHRYGGLFAVLPPSWWAFRSLSLAWTLSFATQLVGFSQFVPRMDAQFCHPVGGLFRSLSLAWTLSFATQLVGFSQFVPHMDSVLPPLWWAFRSLPRFWVLSLAPLLGSQLCPSFWVLSIATALVGFQFCHRTLVGFHQLSHCSSGYARTTPRLAGDPITGTVAVHGTVSTHATIFPWCPYGAAPIHTTLHSGSFGRPWTRSTLFFRVCDLMALATAHVTIRSWCPWHRKQPTPT